VAKQDRRLGRGIASLLTDVGAGPQSSLPTASGTTPMTREIPVQSVRPNPLQPRTQPDPEQFEELARSIRAAGVIQPIVVRPCGDAYELVAGERRWRATQQAGLSTIPAVVRDVTDQQMLEFALIENIHREDLNPIDRAQAYRHCCDRFGLTPESLAEHLAEDRSTIANYIRLLDLPESVQTLVREGSLSMGHARSLLGLPDPETMERLATETVENAFSVRHLEELVRAHKEEAAGPAADTPPPPVRTKRPLIQDLEQRFTQALQTRVTIREGRKRHTGKVVIEYYNLDDFDRVAERLGVTLDEL